MFPNSDQSELLAILYAERKKLSIAYLVLLVLTITVWLVGPTHILTRLGWLPSSDQAAMNTSLWIRFFSPITQLLFLWGGGRLTHQKKSSTRVLLPAIVALMAAFLCLLYFWGILLTWDFELVSTPLLLAFFPILFTILPAAILRSRSLDHYRTLVFLNSTMLWCVGILVSFDIAVVMSEGQAWGLSHLPATALLGPWYALVWVLGTSLVLLWYRKKAAHHVSAPAVGSDVKPAERSSLDSGPYISSAASISALLLVILYFGISQGISYGSHLNEIGDARRSFVKESFRKYISPSVRASDFQKFLAAPAGPERQKLLGGVKETVRNIRTPETLGISRKSFGILEDLNDRICLYVEVNEYNADRTWRQQSCFETKALAAGDGSDVVPDPPAADMATIAFRHDIKPENGETFESLYLRIESELIRKEVSFPNSGFSFPVEQAVWVSNFVVFLMLVLLHDRIGHAFGGQNLGKCEPWLVLDAKDRVAMVVAKLWCFAIGFGPWLLAVTTARMVLFHGGVYQSRVFFFVFQLLLIIVVLLTSVPLSFSVISRVLRLRAMRTTQRVPVSASASGL